MLFLASCSGIKTSNSGKLVEERGKASYYAKKFQGRKTASGEKYNASKMTAAHRTIPFGTMVEVTNLKNGKTVKVRINDRGPRVRGRIIDVSGAAAKKLDMVKDGVVQVKIAYKQ